MASSRPNFLVIVADDLGFSDLSSFGSEIQTPNIDSLAAPYLRGNPLCAEGFATRQPATTVNAKTAQIEANETQQHGIRFTSFHTAAACSPTRAMLLTGVDHHLTGLGQLSEYTRNSPAHQGQPGHEGYLTQNVVTLPELLREKSSSAEGLDGNAEDGYWTVMSGKWHLGLTRDTSPWARGFDKSFALLPGCANHYGWEPRYTDPDDPPRFFETAVTALHREDADCVSELPDDFYSSDFYAQRLIEYLEHRTDKEQAKPFFAYLPFSAPHWPLQAPEENVQPYKGVYDEGPEALRQQRLSNLKAMGLVAADVVPHEVVTAPGEQAEWHQLSADERAKSARAMEVYAGMVNRMDWNIGRVLDYLKRNEQYDNTYVFFMSDNGAEGASYEAHPIMGENVVAHIQKYYDNRLENIGRKDSFVWYGSRWAQAATAPSRLYKMFSTEGGCRVPLIVKPAGSGLADFEVSESRKGITDAFCTVMDIVPTILDLAGIGHPGSQWRGRQISQPMGKSWLSFLTGTVINGEPKNGPAAIHSDEQVTGWEIAGSGGLRKGRYKITFVPLPRGPQRWELFDIIEDPGETCDIGEQKPEVFAEMLKLWEAYKDQVGVVGVAGNFSQSPPVDEFEDTGKWIRYMGRKDVPACVETNIPS